MPPFLPICKFISCMLTDYVVQKQQNNKHFARLDDRTLGAKRLSVRTPLEYIYSWPVLLMRLSSTDCSSSVTLHELQLQPLTFMNTALPNAFEGIPTYWKQPALLEALAWLSLVSFLKDIEEWDWNLLAFQWLFLFATGCPGLIMDQFNSSCQTPGLLPASHLK